MTIRHDVETFSFLLLAAIAGTTFAFVSGKMPKPSVTLPLPATVVRPSPTDAPLPAPVTSSQTSPDGNKKLSLTQTTHKDNSKTFSFSISDTATNNEQLVYAVRLTNETMSIPYNTFSPDNMLFYVQEHSNNNTHSLVFRTDGKPINVLTNEQYYDATSLFIKKYSNFTYDQITGWASNALLIVLTKNTDGTEGQSFWVEIPSKAIIPLSTKF